MQKQRPGLHKRGGMVPVRTGLHCGWMDLRLQVSSHCFCAKFGSLYASAYSRSNTPARIIGRFQRQPCPPKKDEEKTEQLRAPNVACFDRAVLSSDRALSPSPNPANAASLSLSAPVASLSASGGGAAHPICSSC